MRGIEQAFERLLVSSVKIGMEKAHAEVSLMRPAGRETRRGCTLSWLAGLGRLALDSEGTPKIRS